MVRSVFLLLILWLSSCLLLAGVASTSPSPLISAKSAILMDKQTGLVLWSYNAETPLPMASTTKIITAMVILDHGGDKLDQTVTVSAQADKVGGNSILTAGDTLTLRDLLKTILISSSNQGAAAAAEYLTGGNPQTFIGWMNEKAAQILGPDNNTHFINPHGLYDDKLGSQHFSSAHDLALLTREALTKYPLIIETVAEGDPPDWILVPSHPRGQLRLENHNKILGQQVPGIPGARVDGVKTGYVIESGKCLVSSATLNGWQLIAVVLKGDGSYFRESLNLMHYGFSRFQWGSYADKGQIAAMAPISGGNIRQLQVTVDGPLGAPLPRPEYGKLVQDRVEFRGDRLKAPLRRGQRVGDMVIIRDGEIISSVPAIAMQDVSVAWWKTLFRALLYTILIFAGLYVVGRIYGTFAKIRRRRRRRLQAKSRMPDTGGAHHR